MQVSCPRCQTVLEFTDQPPSFCSRCGCRLHPPDDGTTATFDPGATGAEPGTAVGAGPPPESVGGYRLLRPLGAGGMGTVYEAEDTGSGRRVALKLLSPDYAGSPDAVERFRREGRLASTLVHPRCVFVLAADEEAGRPYIVMELMPGRTLQDLVAEQGPMEPAAAIAHVLDVIDGLQEAHRLGFIHRDVKPSNCFLDAQGRVKVGDFGLAKSLVRSENLTRTGSFLGTLLFAAPEQIKGEPVDAQTDVYAVAATLYYLLTGRAPFDGGDAAATLARTVSEPAPPMRSVRPELDPGLDAVVLRGLERDRARRWRGLAEFKTALLPFQPGALSIATLGMRFAAYLLDTLFLELINLLLAALLMPAATISLEETPSARAPQFMGLALLFLYFALLEGLGGASLGKRLLRLGVRRASDRARPGLAQTLLRTAVFVGLRDLGMLLWIPIWLLYAPPGTSDTEWARQAPVTYLLVSLIPLSGMVVGIAALLAPMRARNGYRGLHEWLSGTRVIQLPRPRKRSALAGQPTTHATGRHEGMPDSLGPFAIRGALRWDRVAKVLLGQDRALARTVWIWLRPETESPLASSRREISRATRLRWLACGHHAEEQWDAFMAFAGGPLTSLVRDKGEPWPRVLPLLEQLTDELVTAGTEGTLPDTLHLDQVWIGPDGQVQLLDIPVAQTDAPAVGTDGPKRGLSLLAQVAALTLEGRPRPPGRGSTIRVPVPLHARPALDRLLGAKPPYDEVGQFQADLKVSADLPGEVGWERRAAHLGLLTVFLFLGMGCCMLPAGFSSQMLRFTTLSELINEKEKRLQELEGGALLECAVGAVNPDPLLRLHAAVQLESDYRQRDLLRQSLDRNQRRYAAQLESCNWLSRQILEQMRKQADANRERIEKERARANPEDFGIGQFRRRSMQIADDVGPPRGAGEDLTGFWIVMLVLWPALWVIWAFLARGGLSYRLAGIALVRRDGRPAGRLQCADRALLVWMPVTALLVLSLWLESRYWSAWKPDESPRWMLALASASWYAALLVLAVYIGLALRRPTRTVHDRLAGTYLVPR
jgi:hypothetical protein